MQRVFQKNQRQENKFGDIAIPQRKGHEHYLMIWDYVNAPKMDYVALTK